MGSVLASFLNNDAARSDLNVVAANLAGVSHSFISAPFVAMSSFVNGTAVAVEQSVGDSLSSSSLGQNDRRSWHTYVVLQPAAPCLSIAVPQHRRHCDWRSGVWRTGCSKDSG